MLTFSSTLDEVEEGRVAMEQQEELRLLFSAPEGRGVRLFRDFERPSSSSTKSTDVQDVEKMKKLNIWKGG